MSDRVPSSWLAGFYKNLKEDDLLKEDRDYLKELAEWHNDEDSTSEIGTGSANEQWWVIRGSEDLRASFGGGLLHVRVIRYVILQ